MELKEGYDVEVLGKPPQDVFCIICMKIMRHPVQMECGHGMCSSCFRNLANYSKTSSSRLTCPVCRKAVDESKVLPVPMLERVIMALQVKCGHTSKGCDWIGELGDMHMHMMTNCKNSELEKEDEAVGGTAVEQVIPKMLCKTKTRADMCGTNDYVYIVRTDLCLYTRTSNCNHGTDIVVYPLHRNCIGTHYTAVSGKFYIIQGDKYRRVRNLNTDEDGTTYTLHENCRQGDFYFCHGSVFGIVYAEENRVHTTTNMNKDERGKDIELALDKRDVLYHWENGKKHYCMKQTGWQIEYTRYRGAEGSKEDTYPFHTSLVNFLPGGLSLTSGSVQAKWKIIYNDKNVLPSNISIKKKINRKHGFNFSDTRLSAYEEDAQVKLLGAHFLREFSGNTTLKDHLENELWCKVKIVEENITLKLKPNEEVYVWQYVLEFKYCSDVFFTKFLAFTDDKKSLPDEIV